MRKPTYTINRTLFVNETYEAEPLEVKMRRILETNEPIDESLPEIYTDKKDGVLPAYDIRTDRFEIARVAMEKIGSAQASEMAKTNSIPEQVGESETSEAEKSLEKGQ